VEFAVEGYLAHQGRTFVERFDANSYLYLTRAMDYYDASVWGSGDINEACRRIQARVLVVSFDSDWLCPPESGRDLALALIKSGKKVTYANVSARFGHDSFLLQPESVTAIVNGFLSN
jgi:homoserine O-acetyltransferase